MNAIRLKSLSGPATFPTDFWHLANLCLLAQQFGWQPQGPIPPAALALDARLDPSALAILIRRLAENNIPPEPDLTELSEAMLQITQSAQRGQVPAAVQARWDSLLDRLPQQLSHGFDPEKFLTSLQNVAMFVSGAGYYSQGYTISQHDATGLGLALLQALPIIPATSRQVRVLLDTKLTHIIELELADNPDPLDFFGGRRQYVVAFIRFVARGPYIIE